MKTYTSPERKLKKVMVEKRRRTRIDRALMQMKNMVLEALHVQPEKYAKMEKADILDLTVRFLRRVRQERQAAVTAQDPRHMYPGAMYPGHPSSAAAAAAAATAASAASAFPFKMAPLRPIPTSLAGHPYAMPRGPFRPAIYTAMNPLKADTRSQQMAPSHELPSTSRDTREHPRRVPTATVTSSSPAEPSSTSSPRASPVTSSTVTSSTEKDDNNNRPSAFSAAAGSAAGSSNQPARPHSEPRHHIEAPIPVRMIKFDHVQDFPIFGPGVWRPWFA